MKQHIWSAQSRSSLVVTEDRSWGRQLLLGGIVALTLVLGGVTVFSSARIMTASHELAQIQNQIADTQQELRFLETEYAQVGSLEKVRAHAEQVGLTQTVVFAGTVQDVIPVAQSTR